MIKLLKKILYYITITLLYSFLWDLIRAEDNIPPVFVTAIFLLFNFLFLSYYIFFEMFFFDIMPNIKVLFVMLGCMTFGIIRIYCDKIDCYKKIEILLQ